MPIKTKPFIIAAAIATISFASGFGLAQTTKHGAGSHQHASSMPQEAGQSAFAAIAEIVQILSNDLETDWAKVDITALREHLVDMNALTLNAVVIMEADGETVTFRATAPDAPTRRALQNMVPAHARELDKMEEWNAQGIASENGAALTLVAADKSTAQKIKALGFFGLMATGGHHQPHHLAMASGNDLHEH